MINHDFEDYDDYEDAIPPATFDQLAELDLLIDSPWITNDHLDTIERNRGLLGTRAGVDKVIGWLMGQRDLFT